MKPDDLRARLAVLLDFAAPATPPEFGVVARAERDGYVEQRVVFSGAEGDVPAFLLVPDGADRPLPAVVVHHQHHGEWHVGKSEVAGLAGDPLQAFGPTLARRGLVVLAADAPGFEDRRPSGPGTDPRGEDDRYRYLNEMGHRLVAGRLLMTTVLRDSAAALAALSAHPAVDPDAVGVAGHSMGGTTTLFHAALDGRVRFAAVSGAACTYRRRLADGTAIELASAIPGIVGRRRSRRRRRARRAPPAPARLGDRGPLLGRRRRDRADDRRPLPGRRAAARAVRGRTRAHAGALRDRRRLAGGGCGYEPDLTPASTSATAWSARASRSRPAIARALPPGAMTRTVGASRICTPFVIAV